MKKRFLSLVLALVVFLSLVCSIVSCGKNKGDDSSSSVSQTSDVPASDASSTTDTSGTSDTTDEPGGTDTPKYDKSKVKLVPIDFPTMTYVGTSLKDFRQLFDEQTTSGDPLNGKISRPTSSVFAPYDADNDGDIDEDDLNTIFEVTVDLDTNYYVECVYFYYAAAGKYVTLEAGTPFKYEFTETVESKFVSWVSIDLEGEYQYLNFKFKNGDAPTEILIYGYELEPRPEQTVKHQAKRFSYFLGINGNKADSDTQLDCANYFRDYFTWAWAYDRNAYPKAGTTFNGQNSAQYDSFYSRLTYKNIDVVPCFMWSAATMPIINGMDYYLPESYVMYGEFVHQVALRYGNNPAKTRDDVFINSPPKKINLDFISWIEIGNEPNGEGNDGFNPYELAALTSCAYDGHNSTIFSESGSGVGIKNADPNIKVAMSGLAGVGTGFIRAMTFWLRNNRSDGSIAMEAFNVHTYCRKEISYNGYSIWVGVCPEIGGITDEVKKLVAFRDKYFPEVEIWMTEFGWDTNQSYETENSCHATKMFTGRELQAMWLVRAYFMFAEAGVDRAAMYMCKDTGPEDTTVGKYGTSGVVTKSGEKKDSYYYLATLKNTMGDMYFAEVIDSGNEEVWIYRFEDGNGNSCYAVWCPTMDDVVVDGFTFSIDGSSATMTEFAYGEESGISSDLKVTNGRVTVDVSERPVLIFTSNK